MSEQMAMMQAADLAAMTPEQLNELLSKVHEAKAMKLVEQQEPLRQAFADLNAKAADYAASLGLTAEEYLSATPTKLKKLAMEKMAAVEGTTARKQTERKPVAVKYQNPETNETWTGRGRKPVWVEHFCANGGQLEDLLVNKPQ